MVELLKQEFFVKAEMSVGEFIDIITKASNGDLNMKLGVIATIPIKDEASVDLYLNSFIKVVPTFDDNKNKELVVFMELDTDAQDSPDDVPPEEETA